ncbi:hypothetical protein MRX96_005351 [Rhipicephalus microplus]
MTSGRIVCIGGSLAEPRDAQGFHFRGREPLFRSARPSASCCRLPLRPSPRLDSDQPGSALPRPPAGLVFGNFHQAPRRAHRTCGSGSPSRAQGSPPHVHKTAQPADYFRLGPNGRPKAAGGGECRYGLFLDARLDDRLLLDAAVVWVQSGGGLSWREPTSFFHRLVCDSLVWTGTGAGAWLAAAHAVSAYGQCRPEGTKRTLAAPDERDNYHFRCRGTQPYKSTTETQQREAEKRRYFRPTFAFLDSRSLWRSASLTQTLQLAG